MKRYVVGFAFNEVEDSLALILKARPVWQNGRLNGIGGHIEQGEKPGEAMVREWDEETGGHDTPTWSLFAHLAGDGFEVFFFRGNCDLANIESDSEGEDIIIVSPNELPVNVVSNLHWLIPMARTKSQHDWPYAVQEAAKRLEGE